MKEKKKKTTLPVMSKTTSSTKWECGVHLSTCVG